MRIIAGDLKGRKIVAPPGSDVRPTFDKVKEALFSILMEEIYGAKILDLFAGSGNLGLEALSRGAEKVYFCDKSKESIKAINDNIKTCGVGDKSIVLWGDFKVCLGRIKDEIDIIFLDPPYEENLISAAMEKIEEYGLLSKDGVICCETGKREELPEETESFTMFKERRYGNTFLRFYMYKEGI